MPGCILHVTGDNFDVDAFLAQSPLEPYRVIHRGEPKRKGKKWTYSGFSVEVSSAFGALSEQSRDATTFLSEFRTDLARLGRFRGVTDLRLDFGYLRRDVAVQSDMLPAELLTLVGALGLSIYLTLYPNERQMNEIFAEESAPKKRKKKPSKKSSGLF